MKAVQLKTNYRSDPLGIENGDLSFSWKTINGIRQTAYELRVKDEDGKSVYESGYVECDHMHHHPHISFPYGTRYSWSVDIYDENGLKEGSDPACFSTGLGEWKASWISSGRTANKSRLEAEYFRKKFALKKQVKKADLYVSALGTFTVRINGDKLPGVLDPGSSEYSKRIYYRTFKVEELLRDENEIKFTVNDGWYMGKLGFLNAHNRFGNSRKLIAQLDIVYEDGTIESIITDEDWDCCWDGPIRYCDLKDGIVYDANLSPSFDHKAITVKQSLMPVPSVSDQILEHEEFIPKLLITPSGKKVLDFGQNLAGYVAFRIKGIEKQKVTLSLGEVLDHGEFSRITLEEEGSFNIRQQIIYICNGKEEFFHPEGFYSGFRYALIEGLDQIDPKDFKAIAVYSDLQMTGEFTCSDQMVNQFYQNTLWSLKSNFVDVPTDCPQREKSGWDGDAQVFLPTALYICDCAAFFRKWLKDVRDCQREDGRVENVSPSVHRFSHREPMGGSFGWADAAVIIPYTLWKRYGDDSFIRDNLELMLGWKAYVEKMATKKLAKRLSFLPPFNKTKRPYYALRDKSEKYIVEAGSHWGEWLEPDVDSLKEMKQPKPEITAAYASYSMKLLAEMLRKIGKDKEAEECESFSLGAKQAYNTNFVKDGHVVSNRQASLVRALYFGLLDDLTTQNTAEDLNRNAINRDYTVGTGFLSTPYILHVLSEYGHVDTAYKMLINTKAPGWLAMVKAGATSVWESYEMYDKEGHPIGHSMNHYSPGAVCSFLFEKTLGINVEKENRLLIKPAIDRSLTYARGSYDSPYGIVKSSWKTDGEKTRFEFEIPANCTARIILPDGQMEEVETGSYSYVCKLN